MKTLTTFLITLAILSTSHLEQALASTLNCNAKAATTLTAGIEEDSLLSVYPNPTKGQLKLRLNTTVAGSYKVRVSNTIGKQVKLVDLSLLEQGEETTLDMTTLPAGVYFYSLLVNEKLIETKRLIVQH
jgi:hypothetical protein